MKNQQRIQDFMTEMFLGNARNNYQYECGRWSLPAVYPYQICAEPIFELFDPMQTYSLSTNTARLVRRVSSSSSSSRVVREVKLNYFEKVEWLKFESLLNCFSAFEKSVSFEIFCLNGSVTFFIGSASLDQLNIVCNVFQSYFPGTVFREVPDPLLTLNDCGEGFFVCDFYCSAPYHKKVSSDRTVGCLNSVFKTFSGLKSGECGFYQVIFEPAKDEWGKNVKALSAAEKLASNTYPSGASPSDGFKDAALPLYACRVRLGCVVGKDSGVVDAIKQFGSCFVHGGKALSFRTEKDFLDVVKKRDVAEMVGGRFGFCSGLLLDTKELASFVYFPDRSITSFGLKINFTRGFMVSKALLSGRPIGFSCSSGSDDVICLPTNIQNKCMWILGTARKGKSVSMANQFLWLADNGDGADFIDPHRTTVFELLGLLPDEVLDRVIYLDYDDDDYVVDFNPFDEADEESFGRLTIEFVNSFKNLFEAASFHRMSHLLRMAVYALFVLKKNISSIPALFSRTDEGDALRKAVVDKCKNEEVTRFWKSEFYGYRKDAFSPILNRFSALLMDAKASRIFSREKNKVDLADAMDSGKLLLEALPNSIDVSGIIGGMRIGQTQKCAFARTAKRDSCRREFHLLVDEFHRFSTGKTLESIINETVKAGLHLCAANQETAQLSDELLRAVLSMPNIMLFNVNFLDAKKLLPVFNNRIGVEDITGLGVGECFVKFGDEIVDVKCFAPRKDYSEEKAKRIIEESRKKYYTPVSMLQKEKPEARGEKRARIIDSF
ncbi:MAG: hypothetical protein WCI77_01115 [Candidatus Omnitrophota bacterium]